MAIKEITDLSFKNSVKAGETPCNVSLAKQCTTEVKEIAGDVPILELAISSEAVDRQSDTLSVDGWELKNFRENPVVLWAHNKDQLPIARSLTEWVEGGKLRSKAEFTPRDLNPLGYAVYEMLRKKFLRATSVGFQPLKWTINEERDGFMPIDYTKQELLEYSVVPVPANPEALLGAKSAGIELKPLVEWAERYLDEGEGHIWVPREYVEEIRKTIKADTVVDVPANVEPGEPTDEPEEESTSDVVTDDPETSTSEPESNDGKGFEQFAKRFEGALEAMEKFSAVAEKLEKALGSLESSPAKDEPEIEELGFEDILEPEPEPNTKDADIPRDEIKEVIQDTLGDLIDKTLRRHLGRVD